MNNPDLYREPVIESREAHLYGACSRAFVYLLSSHMSDMAVHIASCT